MTRLGLLVLMVVLSAPVRAATFSDAEALFNAGAYDRAAEMAATLETADGDALAARALLLKAAYLAPEGEDRVLLARGKVAAERALARDDNHVEGMLYLVIALGYEARLEKPMAAHEAGYGRDAKRLLKRAEKLDPDNPWVWATWGGWHAEIARSAGGFFASLFYGASAGRARRAFDRAIALDPGDPAIRVEYAKVLLRMGKKHRGKARDVLDAAEAIPARTAFQVLLKDQGRQLSAALDDEDALKAALAAVIPFEN
jgi:tetratricopeptide (TPR) repeat protein